MQVAVVSPPPSDVLVDKPGWAVDGFRQAGHQVRRCHTLAEVRTADAECDLLVFDHKGAGCNHNSLADMAANRRAVWVQWWRDLMLYDSSLPLAKQPYLLTFRRLMAAMDAVLIKERSVIEEYQRLGINAVYLDQACPDVMPPCKYAGTPEWDVLVLGSCAYDQRRADARALVAAGFKVLWAALPDSYGVPPGVEGHHWVHPINELPALASRCACVLGVDLRHDVPGYTSDRSYLVAGCGAPLIALVPEVGIEWGLSALADFAPQADVASWIYSDTDDLLACVRQAVASQAERRRRGEQGRQRVLDRHTYRHRAEQIIETAGSLGLKVQQPSENLVTP